MARRRDEFEGLDSAQEFTDDASAADLLSQYFGGMPADLPAAPEDTTALAQLRELVRMEEERRAAEAQATRPMGQDPVEAILPTGTSVNIAPPPATTGLPPGVTQADLDAIAAQFRQAGYQDTPPINFTGDPNQPFFDMRTPEGGVDPRYFVEGLTSPAINTVRTEERGGPTRGEPDRQCPPNMEFDYELGRCVRKEVVEPPVTTPPPTTEPPVTEPPATTPPPTTAPPVTTPPPTTAPPRSCPPGYIYNPETRQCEAFLTSPPPTTAPPATTPPPTTVPPTTAPPSPTPPPTTRPPVTCPPGYALNAQGRCAPIDLGPCEPGYVRSTITGRCEPTTTGTPPPATTAPPVTSAPPATTAPPTTTGPGCKQGEIFSTTLGRCVPITTEAPATTPPPATTTPPPGVITKFDPSAAMLEAYKRMFGTGVVNLGQSTPINTGTTTSPLVATTGVNTPTPGTATAGSPVPLPGFKNVTFTPGQPQFFGQTGGLLPGTVPSGYNPIGNYKGPLPGQMIAQNPNLSPTILGGLQGLGYYVDRLGNRIMSPGGGFMRFAEGGEANKEEAASQSAQAELRALLEAMPAETETEVSVSPTARSVRRTKKKAVDTGKAKGISMSLEESMASIEPPSRASAREQLAALMRRNRNLAAKTFSASTLAARGPLATRRFEKGGEVKKKEDRRLTPYEIMEQLGTGLATGVGKQIEGTAAMVQDPAGAFQALRDQLDKVIKDPENIPGWVKDFVVEKLQRASSGPEGAGEVLADFLRLPGKGVPKRDIFIGEKSPSFDHEAKTMAEALEKRGAPKDEIIDITKTFRSADGGWKQEASDDLLSFDLEGFSKAPRLTEPRPFKERFEDALRSLSPESRRMYGPERTKYAFGQLTSPTQKPIRYEMSDFISHPVLEKAYPGITQGLLERTAPDAGYLGSASASGKGLIELNTNPAIRKKMKNPREFDPRATLVHEFQHLVQRREGSAPGGSPEIWRTENPRDLFDVVFRYPRYGYMPPDFIGDAYRKAQSDRFDKNLPKEERKKAAALLKELETTYSPNNLYRALMGEAEARAAQARTYLTPEERAARSPLKDYDVDFEKQLDLREPGAYPSFYYSGRNPFAVDKSKK